ncbi:hypothetical protein [Streptosporangium lutulentum]|uniref:Uncharacterized protein n=1 Tax=Streptosporangium lutulentum TaxID=1461250 RepID=A0ABT9Q999_9ACTN|nr:hypothetical protein [Streptosporangium lutulentum]MDP9843325.1 hypothetical protein [Streptosporangium lutulentum]
MSGLFQVIAVHCFFHCGHVERGITPEGPHNGMEQHYRKRHADDIERIRRNYLISIY